MKKMTRGKEGIRGGLAARRDGRNDRRVGGEGAIEGRFSGILGAGRISGPGEIPKSGERWRALVRGGFGKCKRACK